MVDFPDPDAPTSATILPDGTTRLKSESTVVSGREGYTSQLVSYLLNNDDTHNSGQGNSNQESASGNSPESVSGNSSESGYDTDSDRSY